MLGRAVTVAVWPGLVVALVLMSTRGLIFALLALATAGFLTALVVLGPRRLGTGFMILAMFTAPQNSVRPIASADFVTFSDLFVVLGACLLLPVMLSHPVRYPLAWLIGCVIVLTMVLLASALAPDPGTSLLIGLRLPAATLAVPLVFLAWRPDGRTIDVLAASYVAGHCVSTGYALVLGAIGNRYYGLTTHFNFFGLSAVVATMLLVHLFARVRPSRRWVVWGAGLVCVASAVMSGSRAAVLVIVVIGLLYPLMERSVASAYLLLLGALGAILAGDRLLAGFGSGSALQRLQGDATTSTSDALRSTALEAGLEKFRLHPILGNGFDLTALYAHNIFLEVAIAIGLVGLVGHLLILGNAVLPMLGRGELRRLGYVALGYAAAGMLTNSLWDRFVWMGISLSLLAAAEARRHPGAHAASPSGRLANSSEPAPVRFGGERAPVHTSEAE